jgi:SAM-dependent methyltransferase
MQTELEAYVSQAGHYDKRTRPFQRWRQLVVDELAAQPGDTVLDVGCGTGLCLPALREKVGSTGTVVGIDRSEEMLTLAGDRVRRHGWSNVRLIPAPLAEDSLPRPADAAIFCAVHDLQQSPAALENIFDHLRDGAPVAVVGGKWPSPWLWSFRVWVATLHAPFVSNFEGFDMPWRLLMDFVPDLDVREVAGGAGYLATGHAKRL